MTLSVDDFLDLAGRTSFLTGLLLAILGAALAIYLVGAIGWMKVYDACGMPVPWGSFVPLLSSWCLGHYIAEELEEAEALSYIMQFGWIAGLLAFVPHAGLLSYAWGILMIVQIIRWILMRGGGAGTCVVSVLFSFLTPWLMLKYVE